MKKNVSFFAVFMLLMLLAASGVHAEDYSSYSNEKVAFGLNLHTDHTKPEGDQPSGVNLSDYNTYYYNEEAYENKDKVIYLTFDCGYENGNTPKILDALIEADVKAVFFVTTPFVKENPDLVRRMKEEGHLVGNHTTTHPSLPDKSVSEIQKEMNQCKDTMEKLTGYEMDPFMRPPMGHYSVRVMKVLQDMGYNTMLWSLAIYDYDEENQPGADYVVEKFKNHHFCGMMPLLHGISSSDAEALPEIISSMEDEGYRFGMVSEFLPGQSRQDKEKEIKKITVKMEKIRSFTQEALKNSVTALLKAMPSPQ